MFNKYKFSKFCTDQRGLLLQLAYSWCHDKAMAEDLLHDAIEKALKNINSLNDIKLLKAWFIKIMLNGWRDYLRRKYEHQNIDDMTLSDSMSLNEELVLIDVNTPEAVLSSNQIKKSVRHAISQLPLKYRTVVTLVDIYSASYSEVAIILDIPVGTVMSRISRARQELVKLMSVTSNHNKVVPIQK